jgi:hypothetical protein
MLKKMILVAAFTGAFALAKSQNVVDFENLSLPPDSFWNGSDMSGSFTANGIATFPNSFVDWGGGMTSWSGFAYSNKADTVTQDFSNQYSNFAGNSLINSPIFGVNYNNSDWNTGQIIPNVVSFSSVIQPISMYVTNSTYAALTMKNGDAYSKKFGGTTGDDPDWFKLTITGMLDSITTGTVEFYLADYRFIDNAQDYIVKDWQNVDLTSLGAINKLSFSLSSSDTGMFGMNTPAYFCFDNIMYSLYNTISENHTTALKIYPNPSSDVVFFNKKLNNVEIYNSLGQIVLTQPSMNDFINIRSLPSGYYLLKATDNGEIIKQLLIKK